VKHRLAFCNHGRLEVMCRIDGMPVALHRGGEEMVATHCPDCDALAWAPVTDRRVQAIWARRMNNMEPSWD